MKWSEKEVSYLKQIYNTDTPIDEIISYLGKSKKAVRHKAARLLLERPNIPSNKPKNRNHRNIVDKDYYDRNREQIYLRKKKRLQERKRKLVGIMGNKCGRCNYNKCIAALEFHHTGDNKEDHVTKIIRDFSEQKALKEIKKCILVCANCHRELHHNKGLSSNGL